MQCILFLFHCSQKIVYITKLYYFSVWLRRTGSIVLNPYLKVYNLFFLQCYVIGYKNFRLSMPLKLDIKRRLTARSDRVKSCDLHPTEPWMLVSLYNGNVHIWNHESQQLVKSFEVCDLPVRASVFVPRKNWVVTGSDDMQVVF